MGHAVGKDLLSLVQTEVKGIINDLNQQSTQLFQVQNTAAVLQGRLDERDARLDAVEAKREEMEIILERLLSIEKVIREELARDIQGIKETFAVTNTEMKELGQKVDQLEESHAETVDRMDQLEHGLARTAENLQEGQNKTNNRVDQLEHEFKSQRMDVKQGELIRKKVICNSIRAVVI